MRLSGAAREPWGSLAEAKYEGILKQILSAVDRKDVSHRAFSKQCGFPEAYLAKLRSGEMKLTIQRLVVICRELDMEVILSYEGRYIRVGSYVQAAAFLRAVRKRKKLLQKEVAASLGRVTNAVCQWEKNDKQPYFCVMIAWAASLGVNLEVRKKRVTAL